MSVIYFHIRLEYKVKKKYLSRSCRIPGGQALFLLWKLEEAGVQLTYWVVRPLATFSAVGCKAVAAATTVGSRGRYSLSRSRMLSPPKKARCSAAADMVRVLKGNGNKRQ